MSMRLDIAKALKSRLVAKGCPLQTIVLDEETDSERKGTNTGARERIVLERDVDASDAFSEVRGQHGNPKHKLTRSVPFKLTIYAQNSKTGALSLEHEARMDALVETVIASLDDVLRADLQVLWRMTGGGFVRPDDFAESKRQPGLVYAMTFTADRAVRGVTFAGAAREEAELTEGMVRSRTDVGLTHGPTGAPVVTSCGGNGDEGDDNG